MRRRGDDSLLVECDDLVLDRLGHGERIRAIDGLSLRLAPGGLVGVAGPAGSGKSTLVGALAAADDSVRIAGGTARICGTDVRARGRAGRIRRARTGWVPQGGGAELPPEWTVAEYVAQPIAQRDRRVNRRALAVRVATLLDELHLPLGAGERFPFELSAGMRQRVAIARALVLEPRVLIADEILANLDPDVGPVVLAALHRRREEQGMGVLLAMSDAGALAALGAEILVLRSGHVVARGVGDELRWSPGAQDDTA